MSTTTETPPTEPSKPEHHDEFTGAFGFFRKYQKLILYSAGIFALITFSITGAMTSWLRGLTAGPTGPQPTIQVLGATVELQVEDQLVGGRIARHMIALPPSVLPRFMIGNDSTDLATRLAILRRAAIQCGLDVSMDEVDAAIGWMVRAFNKQTSGTDTPTQMALQRGLSSLAEYRDLVKEAMRIGNYVTLASVGVDTGDAAIMRRLLDRDGAEKIALRVATFDMKALEKELKAKGNVTEADVKTWMEGKSDADKTRLEVFDTNKVALHLGVVRFKDFDAAQWTEELSAFAFGEEQQKRLYKQEADRFKDEKGKVKPMDDAAVQAEMKSLAQVDEVLNKLLGKIREAQQNELKPLYEAQQTAAVEKSDHQRVRDAAKAASTAAPEDQDLQQKLREAEQALEAKDLALKAAGATIESVRKAFDFRAKWTELTAEKKGFELREVGAPRVDGAGGDLKNAKALKDLSGVELGDWKLPELATSLRNVGDLGGAPARATNGAFLLQIADVEVRPMKPWDELKTHLEEKYYEEQARKAGDEKKKAFEDELLRLAKEKIPEQITEITAKKQPEVDKQFGEWEKKLTDELAKANETLAKVEAGTQAEAAWQKKKAAVEAELATREEKRKAIEKSVDERFEGEIKDAAKKKFGEVLEPAAQVAGFTVTTTQPYRRDLSSQQQFAKRYERTIVFLWGGIVRDLEVGENTGILEDATERRYQLAVCDQVLPLTVEDVTRREFEMLKRVFAYSQVGLAMQQSFSSEALKARYHYVEAEGRQVAK